MKNIRKLMMIFCVVCFVLCSFVGCGDEQGSSKTQTTSSLNLENVESQNTQTEKEENNETKKDDNFVDLTTLSSTMVYAEVYNIMCEPDDYTGKTIKMTGQFTAIPSGKPNEYYYACLISDAMACCQQGIEFVLADETITYPDDYPAEGGNVTVTGEFELYTENGTSYCHLINAKME